MEYAASLIGIPPVTWRKLVSPLVGFARHLHDHFVPTHRNNYHPHILGHRALALFSALLVGVKVVTITGLTMGPVLPAYSSAITVQNVISLTNASRQDFGLSSLTENSVLNRAAQAKADDMLANNYFSHNTPDGKTPWDFIVSAGYNYLTAGENLAVNFTEAESVEQAWMNSPGHKANILNRNFEEIGIGIAQGEYQGHAAIFVVQMFGAPAEQKISITETPTKVLTESVPKPAAAAAPKAAQKVAQSEPAAAQLAVLEGQTAVEGGLVRVTVRTEGDAVKVLARFGQAAVMLDPTGTDTWSGSMELSRLAAGNLSVRAEAYDMENRTANLQLANFANTTAENYKVAGAFTEHDTIRLLGRTFDPKGAEQQFYLGFILLMLVSLALAIGIKRHIQHLGMVFNTSLVVMLAVFLWIGG